MLSCVDPDLIVVHTQYVPWAVVECPCVSVGLEGLPSQGQHLSQPHRGGQGLALARCTTEDPSEERKKRTFYLSMSTKPDPSPWPLTMRDPHTPQVWRDTISMRYPLWYLVCEDVSQE